MTRKKAAINEHLNYKHSLIEISIAFNYACGAVDQIKRTSTP
ncbi:MAG: hypothetical protein ACJAZH_000157 [Roseivirga sp.]|jgi:hypothetical protein